MMMPKTAVLLSVALTAAVCPGECEEPSLVTLEGSPADIGATWGHLNAKDIHEDMEKRFFALGQEHGIDRETLVERGRAFVSISKEVAPHWIEECYSIADAAGVDRDLYASYAGNVYRGLFLGHECTSYAVHKDYTKDGAILFHKSRDSAEKPQAVCLVASQVPGVNRFITVTDTSVLACMMMVNDKGLAGSADTGGMRPGKPKFRGIMNTYLLRHIAERAGTCSEALALIEDFVQKGYYAGGGQTGTHWLFVDRHGVILEVSNNAWEVTHAYHEDKVYFSVRGDTSAANALRNATGPIDFHAFHNASRDPSLCFDTTRSAMTVEIHPARPEYLTCAWASLPAKGLAFPLFMGCSGVPTPLVDGEVYRLQKDMDGDAKGTWESIERSAHLSKGLAEGAAEKLIEQGSTKEASRLLTEWSQRQAAAQVAVLRLSSVRGGE